MLNISILEFRNAIKNFVDTSELPDEVKRMVLEKILAEQEEKTLNVMKLELEERNKEASRNGNAESV